MNNTWEDSIHLHKDSLTIGHSSYTDYKIIDGSKITFTPNQLYFQNCKYELIDDDSNTWQCSNCKNEWVLNSGNPKENEMNYCPKCGAKIE